MGNLLVCSFLRPRYKRVFNTKSWITFPLSWYRSLYLVTPQVMVSLCRCLAEGVFQCFSFIHLKKSSVHISQLYTVYQALKGERWPQLDYDHGVLKGSSCWGPKYVRKINLRVLLGQQAKSCSLFEYSWSRSSAPWTSNCTQWNPFYTRRQQDIDCPLQG